MNEMYSMGLVIHSFGAVFLLGVVFLNIVALMLVKNVDRYKRSMSILYMPLSSMAIGGAIFTGSIMMAAKHLDFSIENIMMILISVILIVLEVKRAKGLKYLNLKEQNAFNIYKKYALNLMYIEFALIVLISMWMWFV